ncbi:MAG: PorT family protein [Candidatus Kapabacteria bacterium]|nr:PorT family protein [Candidatus Kapabacteria bacterium]MDW8012804.1 outer membrane beta-barrel protein [Bacteroidota bacterium]
MQAVIALIVAVGTLGVVWAQEPGPLVAQKGLRTGLAAVRFVGTDAEGVRTQLNPAVGVFGILRFEALGIPKLTLLLELLYARRGTEQRISLGGGGYDLRYNLDQLELLVAPRLNVAMTPLPVAIYAGIVPGLRTSGRVEQKIGGGPPKKLEASLRSITVGLSAGAGTELPLRRSARLLVDLRAYYGLLSILERDFNPPLREGKPIRAVHPLALGIAVGVGF